MFFNLFKEQPQATDASAQIVNWSICRARQTFPQQFAKPSDNDEQRQQKFEIITVFMAMAFWYLSKDKQNQDLSQASHDHLFDNFEVALREQGVSDVKLAGKIRKLADTFQQRMVSYKEDFEQHNTSALSSHLTEYGVCETNEAFSLAISNIAESKKIRDLSLDDWLEYIQNPLPGKYEPHELNPNEISEIV